MSDQDKSNAEQQPMLSQNARKSDELPLSKLFTYLSKNLPQFASANQLHVEQFSAGASNITYRIFNGEQALILRRPPSGTKAKSAHDMVREHNVLTQLAPVYPLSPRPVALCTDESVIGYEFFIMQEIEGLGIGKDLPVTLNNEQQHRLCKNFVKSFVELHQIDITQPNLSSLGKPEGYVERQMHGWNERFARAKTDDVASIDSVFHWLAEHLPVDSGLQSLVHNDFKFDNLILQKEQPENIIGVLDWEMTTLGDPLLDLGCSLAYWIEEKDDPSLHAIRMMPTHLPGMMTRQQVFDEYCQLRSISNATLKPYYVFGLFRLAVIAQQIYYRFYHGQTDNPKFKSFGQLVNILISRCLEETSTN